MSPSETPPLRVGVMLSGGGRTLENLLRHESAEGFSVVAVTSNREASRGLEIAREAGRPARAFRLSDYGDAGERDQAQAEFLGTHYPDLIVLAGYMAHLDLRGFAAWPVINIHPALLPAHGGEGMYGAKIHEAVFAAGETESGATVHEVDEIYDHGRTLEQERVRLPAGVSAAEIGRLVFQAECRLYPRVLGRVARGELDLRPVGD